MYQEAVLVPNQPSLVNIATVVRMIRIKDLVINRLIKNFVMSQITFKQFL